MLNKRNWKSHVIMTILPAVFVLSGLACVSNTPPPRQSQPSQPRQSQPLQPQQSQPQQPQQTQPAAPPPPVSLYWTGNGGRDITLAVLEPTGRGISAQEQWVLPLIQGSITGDINKYSAMTVIDRMNLEKTIAEQMQTVSGLYSDDDYLRIGNLTKARLILTGSVARTANAFMLELSVTEVESGQRKASYPPKSVSLASLENLSAIKEASAELLGQLGVELTDRAAKELKSPVDVIVQWQAMQSQVQNTNAHVTGEGQQQAAQTAQAQLTDAQTQYAEVQAQINEIQAQIALAKGITAQRKGTSVEALSYYLQAAAFNPSLSEAASRSSTLHADISSGNIGGINIGDNVRNDIAWRKQWVDRLTETEQFFDTFLKTQSMPYTLFYSDEIKQGSINWQNETVTLSMEAYLHCYGTWTLPLERTLQAVWNGFNATERRSTWELANWPTRRVTNLDPFGRRANFSVAFELLNEQNKVIGKQTINTDGNWRLVYSSGTKPSFSVSSTGDRTVNFQNVAANDITDKLTIRVASINGTNAETAAKNGVLQIRAMTKSEFDMNRRFSLERGRISSGSRSGSLAIPNAVWGEPVVVIGSSAFSNSAYSSYRLTSITIPNSVTSIGDGAFSNNKLTSITIPNSVTHLSGFGGNQLTSITIPNSVTSIGSGAFSENQLTSITIPNSVTSIGSEAFSENRLTSVTIPNSVTTIGEAAFQRNKLTSVTIPNSVTSIGSRVFSENQLTSVTIPNSVTSIGYEAFSNNQLTSVTIPNSVTVIGKFAFSRNQLTSITIGANVNIEYSDEFFSGFKRFYDGNGKRAGTYRKSDIPPPRGL